MSSQHDYSADCPEPDLDLHASLNPDDIDYDALVNELSSPGAQSTASHSALSVQESGYGMEGKPMEYGSGGQNANGSGAGGNNEAFDQNPPYDWLVAPTPFSSSTTPIMECNTLSQLSQQVPSDWLSPWPYASFPISPDSTFSPGTMSPGAWTLNPGYTDDNVSTVTQNTPDTSSYGSPVRFADTTGMTWQGWSACDGGDDALTTATDFALTDWVSPSPPRPPLTGNAGRQGALRDTSTAYGAPYPTSSRRASRVLAAKMPVAATYTGDPRHDFVPGRTRHVAQNADGQSWGLDGMNSLPWTSEPSAPPLQGLLATQTPLASPSAPESVSTQSQTPGPSRPTWTCDCRKGFVGDRRVVHHEWYNSPQPIYYDKDLENPRQVLYYDVNPCTSHMFCVRQGCGKEFDVCTLHHTQRPKIKIFNCSEACSKVALTEPTAVRLELGPNDVFSICEWRGSGRGPHVFSQGSISIPSWQKYCSACRPDALAAGVV